jgi:N-acetylmuramate 1-kinase
LTVPNDAAKHLDEWLGSGWTARPLAGDASVRAYYRVRAGGQSYILCYYPEEVRPQLQRFLSAYERVAPHAPVPELLHSSDIATLQRDAGDRTLFDVLHEDREEGVRLYHQAIELLVQFQKAGDARVNVPFTAQFFLDELAMAREYYVEQLMGRSSEALQPYMKMLCDEVAQHPYQLCHRDFHGQNLHIINNAIYLLDYQDLRQGPDTYDMASLLRDRGVARILGDETELALLAHYRALTGADESIRSRYFEVLLQRSIKILGTFSKQPIVRGRMHYLEWIPPTLESIRRCIGELPRYGELAELFPLEFDLEAARERARKLNEAQ